MTSAISTAGLQQILTANLINQQTTLATLNEQLSSNQQHSDLTDYSFTDAHNLMNIQNNITQRQAYLSSITTVQSRLSVYDTTMTDMENVTQLAQTMANQNSTLDTSKIGELNAQVKSYLQSIGNDLNQTSGGRYVYGGSSYTTQPVIGDLTTLGAPSTLPFTPATSPALPDYSSNYVTSNSFTIAATPPTGNFKIGNTTVSWASIAAGNVSSVSVNGTTTAVTVNGLTAASTPTQLASNLQKVITQLAANSSTPDFSGISATASSGAVTLAYTGSIKSITPDSSGTYGDVAWSDGTDGTSSENMGTTDTAAYAKDSVSIDNDYSVQYGVTSNDPGFQQVIAGLRLMNAATQTGVSAATYQSYMSQASTLLSTGLSNIQSTHSVVASNINTLTTETTTQNNDITALQNQLSGIQSVDTTTVGTELTLLQTQLSASYSATASLEQLSILKYL